MTLPAGFKPDRFHGVADQGVPVTAKSPEEAAEHFGWMTHFVSMDVPASSAKTQQQLGWRPTHAALIPDLDHPRYFDV